MTKVLYLVAISELHNDIWQREDSEKQLDGKTWHRLQKKVVWADICGILQVSAQNKTPLK